MKIFILHGYLDNIAAHWFPWLSQELTQYNHTVHRVYLPNSTAPCREEWVQAIREAIGTPDKDTLVITHSLGGYSFLKYVTELNQSDWTLSGLILVSGFLHQLAAFPGLDEFLSESIDPKGISAAVEKINSILMIHSDNDHYVPPQDSIELAQLLGAEIVKIPGGGHFETDDGYITFPELLTEVRTITKD